MRRKKRLPEKPLYSLPEAASMLGCSRQALWERITVSRTQKAEKVGKHWVIKLEDLRP